MTIRIGKLLLLAAIGFFYSLVAFNNITDYNSNYLFVTHVLAMDTTFPGNQLMWRSIHSTFAYKAFYNSIICWELANALLTWAACVLLTKRLHAPAEAFNRAKGVAVAALTLGLLLWLVAFLTVGAEWFLMWQSKVWNGQEAAFRMFTVSGIILIFVIMPDKEEQA